jgi:hypothetical protein
MDAIDEFIDIAHAVAWCTVATVDRHSRPRSRILHPVWARHDGGLRGWVATTRTPVKVAHLGHAPYVSCSYWHPSHDTAQAECAAAWVTDDHERAAVWERFATAPPPLGYDPAAIWPDGPRGAGFAVLRMDAWRVRLRRGTDAGRPFTAWSSAPRAALAA